MSRVDVIGRRFGRLLVTAALVDRKVLCLCDCGNYKAVDRYSLLNGDTQSCRCLHHEIVRGDKYEHPAEYEAWCNARARCRRTSRFKTYGPKGVRVCRRWHSFPNFFKDLGPKPTPRHSVGRILDRGNYTSRNAFWMTPDEQNLQKRNNHALARWEEKRGHSTPH